MSTLILPDLLQSVFGYSLFICGPFLTFILHGSNRLGAKALFWLESKRTQQALI